MGNWALRGAVQAMRTFVGNNIPPLFDEVILAGADEDDDTLQCGYKIGPLLRGCRRVTVYYNHQDLSLKASDYAMGNPDRLGRSRSAEHTSELQSLMRISYAVFCLKKKIKTTQK